MPVSTTFTGIFADYSRKEYSSIEKARDAGCTYLMKGNAQDGGDILKLNGEKIPFIEIGRWKLHNPHENRRYSIKYKSQVRVEDPLGELQFCDIDNPLKIDKIIHLLENLSSFNSWNEYHMQKRIEGLEAENKRLINIADNV